MSSTTVLNWRAHGVERVAERRATLLGRMVNDMIELSEREERGTLQTVESRVASGYVDTSEPRNID